MTESIFCPKCLSIPFLLFRTISKSQAHVHKNVSLTLTKLTVTPPSCQFILSPSFICLISMDCLTLLFLLYSLYFFFQFWYLSRISQVTDMTSLKILWEKWTSCTLPALLFFWLFMQVTFYHCLDYKLHDRQTLSILYNNLLVIWHCVIPNTSPDFNKVLVEWRNHEREIYSIWNLKEQIIQIEVTNFSSLV